MTPSTPITVSPTILDAVPPDVPNGLTYTWAVTDESSGSTGITTYTGPSFTFTPDPPQSMPSVYKITLTVTDAYGGTATASQTTYFYNVSNIVVNTTSDQASSYTQDGVTYVPLRAALAAALSATGSTLPVIKFDPSLVGDTIDLTAVGDSNAGATALGIPSGHTVEIDGSAAPGLTLAVAPGSNMRLFYVAQGATLTLADLNLTGGSAPTLSGLAAGGAIYVDGKLNLYDSALYNNQAIGQDFNASGFVYGAAGRGGAIYVSSLGGLLASEDTFAFNTAEGTFSPANNAGLGGAGGALFDNGYLSLNGCTIADNTIIEPGDLDPSQPADGAGVYDGYNASSPGLDDTAYSSIIADNSGGNDYAMVQSFAGNGIDNLIGSLVNPPTNDFAGPFVVSSANPLLGPFADHGDGIKTFSLLPGSPAIGRGTYGSAYIADDGRGYPHLVGNKDIFDIGAFQTQPYLVTNTNDGGPGSLRAAVAQDDNGAPIDFAPGLSGQKITLTSGPIAINNSNVSIVGPGADALAIAAAPPTGSNEWTGNGTQAGLQGTASAALQPANGASYTVGPVAGSQAFQFNGSSTLIAPDNGTLDTPAFTVGGWFELTAASASYLASKYGGNYNGWILNVNGSLMPAFQLLQSSTANVYVSSSTPLALNHWYYLAATYDGTNLRLYVNGVQAGGATLNGGYTPSPTPLTLGGASWYNGGRASVNIADFAYFNSSLSPGAVATLSQPNEPASNVFVVNPGASANISGVTITDGEAPQGGGVYNAGNLTLSSDLLTLDTAQGLSAAGASAGLGGAVYNAPGAALIATDTTFAFDNAVGLNSTSGAGSAGRGGAVYNAAGAVIVALDDTFAGDDATGGNGTTAGGAYGGAIDNAGAGTLTSSTVDNGQLASGNGAPPALASDGIGIENETGATLALNDTIVAHQSPRSGTTLVGTDVANPGSATGTGNLVMTNDGLPGALVTSTANPDLGALEDNGGPTPTLAPRVGSPAIDAGVNAVLTPQLVLPGLVHEWAGNGTAQDSVGGLNGTLIGGTTFAAGPGGQTFSLNGQGQYVALPTGADLTGTGAFTISAWVKTTSSADETIIQQRDTTHANGEYSLEVNNGKVYFWTYSNGYGLNFTSNSTVNDGNWHLITVVRTAAGTGQIFIDGALNATQSAPPSNLLSGSGVYIGGDERDNIAFFNGQIGQVSLYTTALNGNQIFALGQLNSLIPSVDQRGFTRISNGTVDVGAVETQPYVVTNTNDSGPGSLRAAVTGDTQGDQPILFSPGLDNDTITLTSGPLVISNSMTIDGPGANLVTVSGGGAVQDFVVTAGNVTISGLTIAGGLAAQGGGIYNAANLTLTNDIFSNDTAENDPAATVPDGQGGAIYNAQGGQLTVTGSTFNNDVAIGLGVPGANPEGQGGAIYNAAPTVNASGIVTNPGGTLTATDDTFNGDAAQQGRRQYGTQGYDLVNNRASLPSYAPVTFVLASPYTWAASTNDPRALQDAAPGTTDRVAATAYESGTSVPLTFSINLTDGQPHTVTLYVVDYDSTARSETIQPITANGGYILGPAQTVTNFHNGEYLSWVVQGNVTFQALALTGAGSVVSGIFIDPAPAGAIGTGTYANYLGKDVITEGNWKSGPAGTGLGGAIDNEGNATLLSDTIDGNSVASSPAETSEGAGIENGKTAILTIDNTIVANDNGGHDLANLGVITGGNNLVTTSSGVAASVIASNANPDLGPLASNGGPTPTMALLAGSPTIDAGNNAYAPANDQRGLPRIAGSAIDLGAYEYATPIVVTNTNDSGPGSLRAALGLVATYPGSPIGFAPSLAGQTIDLASELIFPNGVTIDSSAAPGLVIQGNGLKATNGSSRDIFVGAGVTATIRDLTIAGGFADNGGGVYNGGNLTLQGVTIEGNSAYASGGGIANDGTLSVIDSTITGNTLALVSGQTTTVVGAGIRNSGTLSLEGDTIVGNTAAANASSAGGGLDSAGGSITLHNTILAENSASQAGTQDVDVTGGTVTSLGHNIVGTTTGPYVGAASDLSPAGLELGPLQNNGGPTPTMALLAGSTGIDAGDLTGVPSTDQRGLSRDSGAAPDIGAYERQPFVVTSTAASGPGSLAQAVVEDHDGSTITFAPALAGQTIVLGGKVPIASGGQTQVIGGRLVLGGNVTINGSAAPGLVISGGNAVGVLEIAAGANVTLQDLSIEDGSATTGGGILVDAGATLTLDADTIANNNATGNGGGLENQGTLNVVESTFADNSSGGNGGGIDTGGSLTLQDSTIGHNSAYAGGGLFMEGGTVTIHNTIIGDNNAATDPDASARLTSQGYNMIGNGQGVTGTVSTDMVGVDPQLGPLQNNGGPTETLAPAATSPAVDGGDPTGSPATDQRGLARVMGLAIDVGAVESQYVPPIANPGGGATGYIIRAGDSLTLDASGSYDPNGLPLSDSWDINGDGVFGDATGVKPTLTWAQLEALGITPRTEPYQVRVQVTDGYAANSYVVTSAYTNLEVLPGLNIVSLAASSNGAVNSPVTSATVTFSSPVDPTTIGAGDVSLTLDGGPNLITRGAVQIAPVSGTVATYQIISLSALDQADGQYTLTVNAAGVSAADGSGDGNGTASVTWLMDTTPPDSNAAPLAPVQTGTSFAVTAVGDDPSAPGVPASGLVACDLYVSTNGGPYAYWTTVHPWAPTAIFQGQQGDTYAFYSIGHDAAGNEETPRPAEAVTRIPDLTPPVTHVTSVDCTTPRFKVSYSGTDTGGSGLKDIRIYVQVDGGKPQLIGTEAAASGTITYRAIVDGRAHTYRFYSIGVDNAGNVQAAPTNPQSDVVVTFTHPVHHPEPIRIVEGRGETDRSHVPFIDTLFDRSSGLESLIEAHANNLIDDGLNGDGALVVPVTGDPARHRP